MIYLFWAYAVVLNLFLLYKCTIGAYIELKEYENTLALSIAWKQYFEEYVPSRWIFYDGIGG